MTHVAASRTRLSVVQGGAAKPSASTLDALFRQHARFVGGIAYRILGRDGEIDDVVQEVFLETLRAADRLDLTQPPQGWFATVTVRVAAKRLRRRRMRKLLGFDTGATYEHMATPDASPETRAQISRLYCALDDLPPAERLAWTLRHIEGEQLDAVAERCACSLATAKRRIAAAHSRLQKVVGHG